MSASTSPSVTDTNTDTATDTRADPAPDPVVAAGATAERTLIGVAPATSTDWSRAIAADALALPEQSQQWMHAITTSQRGRDVSLAFSFGCGAIAVVPLIRTGLGATGSIWSPPPAWGIGGIVGSDLEPHMVRAVVAHLRSLRAPRVMVRIDARHEAAWQHAVAPGDLQIPRRSHIIDLPDDPASHFAQLSKSTRTKIRKCAKSGVQIEEDRTGALLDTHYALFLKSVERWADKQHEPAALALFRARRRDPIDKLRAMQRALGDRFVTLVAFVDGQPAASLIVLLGKTTRYTRGAMDIELAGPTRANYGLQWRAIELANEHGSRRYHMGESGESEGIAEFKERLGALPADHHEYRFERLPVTRATDLARAAVKRVIGFRET